MANVDATEIITHVDDESVFVAPDIKHRTPLPEETCRGKILADRRRRVNPFAVEMPHPRSMSLLPGRERLSDGLQSGHQGLALLGLHGAEELL